MEIIPALSKYLQTSGLDFIDTFNMVKAKTKDIQQIHRDFAMVATKTDHFVQYVNEVLEERGCDVFIESSFPAKRVGKSKKKSLDECLSDSMKKFEFDVLYITEFLMKWFKVCMEDLLFIKSCLLA